ncbi:MAG: PD-(D/E)XK nuclease family protein [Lachnospiraceae bacterium]|nr:PD-(D/E)XK nuclease family protein [Lachnospiraceae bacterium]
MISDIDREFLESSGFALAPTPRQRMFIQRLYLYHALGRPSDKLVLSYSASDNKGDPLRPSYLVSRISELFPKLTAVRAGRTDDELPGMGELALMLSEYASGVMSEDKKRVFYTDYALMKQKDKKTVKELTDAAFYRYIPKVLSKEAIQNVYGEMISGSVSRMESFAACAYAHFLSYGLRLKERESSELLSPDMGSIYHEVLERFGKELDDRKMQWADISVKDVDGILPEILEDVAAEYDTQKLYQDARSAYIYKRMGRILRRSIMTVAYQLAKGAFKPVAYERGFERMIKTENGEKALLRGKIDRLDEYRSEDKRYIKVTDYKSSARSLKYDKVLSGEQLQLPLYLYEAVKNAGEDAVPAALFYYILKEPLIEASSLKDGDPDAKIRKELKPKGLISSDMNVINALDGDFSGWSDVMPVYLTKDGKLSGNTRCALSPEDMKALTEYSYFKLKDLTREMLKGRIDISPSDEESCRYCDHKDECMFDMGLSGCAYKGVKHKEEEALELIKEAVKDKDLS